MGERQRERWAAVGNAPERELRLDLAGGMGEAKKYFGKNPVSARMYASMCMRMHARRP